MPNKPVESVIVSEKEAEYWDKETESFILNAHSNFYVLLATGARCYYITKDRMAAQKQADEDWGTGKYKIRTVKDTKSKSKQESGGLSCSGSNSRKGFGSWLKKS